MNFSSAAALRSWHRPLVVLTGAMAVLAAVSVIGLLVDDRVLAAAPIWAKPLKFALSIAVYSLTLAWLLQLLTRGSRLAWWAGTVIATGCVIETVSITGQVVRGRRSHFNFRTPFDSAVYDVMATTITVVWLATVIVAVLLFRSTIADRAAARAIRIGAALGLTGMGLGFLMTRPTPAQMRETSGIFGAHSVGVPDGGPSMPLTGWSTTGGDLRIPHFVGIHALQLIPLALLGMLALSARVPRLRDERARARLVAVTGAAYAALLALVTWQALRGQSLVHPDATTLCAAGLIAVGAVVGAGLSLRRPVLGCE
ncbi:hypothetical protein AB0M57_26830 [Streptomyces sp. NPDC051597]|uniref:hypothetical protein n=1 Tax=Streptomyces sp. NPDC051597 TaxID=3155049 RepID=UPI003422F889